jgi:hypothetical protein
MATSGTTTFSLTLLEILEDAWERATTREIRSGYDFRTATRSYNLLMLDWQSKGYNLWSIASAPLALVANQATYTLPTNALEIVVLTYSTSPAGERPLKRMSLPDYAALPNKLVTGTPVSYLATRNTSTPTVTLYPIPTTAADTLTVWYTRRIQDAGTAVNSPDAPILFMPALIAGLAYYIAQKTPDGLSRIDALKMIYEQALDDAMNDDRDKADASFVPSYAGF